MMIKVVRRLRTILIVLKFSNYSKLKGWRVASVEKGEKIGRNQDGSEQKPL